LKDNYRFEKKVPMQVSHYSEFWHYLHQLDLCPRKSFPKRKVHSVYLDKLSFDYYQDNVAGISQRNKIRLRWYDEDLEKITLEAKIKHNKVSTKPSLKLLNNSKQKPLSSKIISDLLSENSVSANYADVKSLYPVLYVEYTREYYLLNKDIRMTIDKDIKYKRLFPMPLGQIENSVVDVVAEFKYDVNQQASVDRLLSGLPFRLFRHSKYAIGIEKVYA